MIIFIRSSLIERDVRALKYVHYLDKEKVKFIQWDRSNENTSSGSEYITYRLPAEFGLGLKSLGRFFLWNLFLLRTLFKLRKEFKVIQICDLDSFFPSILFRMCGKKVIFDVYDFFADSKISNTNSVLYSILYNFEMFCMRYVDLLILPLEVRKKHLNFTPETLLVCENVPQIKSDEEHEIDMDPAKLNIIYAGTLENKSRGLEWIPEIAVKLKDKVHFYIAGSGTLKDFFQKASEENENISFLGPISHSKALSFQKKADLIYAIYRTNLINNVMAAPNKFYESTFTGTPVLINKGLFISDVISEQKIGFVVDESEAAIEQLLKHIDKNTIQEMSQRTNKFWQLNYNDYVQKKYETEYKYHLARFTNQ